MKHTISFVLAMVAMTGCSTSPQAYPNSPASANPAAVYSGSSGPAAVAARPSSQIVRQFTGIPLPPDNALDLERTVIVGGEDDWLGRILLAVPSSPGDAIEFYRREMPRYGWTELAVTRSTTSVLTYQANDRIATIQIGAGPPGGRTQVEFWMNPRPSGRDPQTAAPGRPREGTFDTPVNARPVAPAAPNVSAVSRGPAMDGMIMQASPRGAVEQAPLPPPWH